MNSCSLSFASRSEDIIALHFLFFDGSRDTFIDLHVISEPPSLDLILQKNGKIIKGFTDVMCASSVHRHRVVDAPFQFIGDL